MCKLHRCSKDSFIDNSSLKNSLELIQERKNHIPVFCLKKKKIKIKKQTRFFKKKKNLDSSKSTNNPFSNGTNGSDVSETTYICGFDKFD